MRVEDLQRFMEENQVEGLILVAMAEGDEIEMIWSKRGIGDLEVIGLINGARYMIEEDICPNMMIEQ